MHIIIIKLVFRLQDKMYIITQRRGGGLVSFVNNNISCTRLTDLEVHKHEEMLLLYRASGMLRWKTHVLIRLVYHPRIGDNYSFTIVYGSLQ